MIDIMNITPGQAYVCKFKSASGTEGFGFLKQRDIDQRLVIVVDEKTNQEFICSFDDIWDIDDVEFTEEP